MTTTEKPTLNPNLMVEVRGKTVPSYAGVLDLAHQWGLTSIRTALIQAPTEANGREAIVHATVMLRSDGQPDLTFEALGDANPQNVNRPIAQHIIRMAETRAKGRALRDATNIGLALAEELGEDAGEPTTPRPRPPATPPATSQRPASSLEARRAAGAAPAAPPAPKDEDDDHLDEYEAAQRGPAPATPPPAATGDISTAQVNAIRAIAGKLALDPHAAAGEILNRPVPHLSALSRRDGSTVITALEARRQARAETGAGR